MVEERYDCEGSARRRAEVTEVAERYHVARQTVHKRIRRYKEGGLGALADRSYRPESCLHQMSPGVEARVLDYLN